MDVQGGQTNPYIGSLLDAYKPASKVRVCGLFRPSLDAGLPKSTSFPEEEGPGGLCLSQQPIPNVQGVFLSIIGRDPSVSKSKRLCFDIFWFFFINLRCTP